MPHAAIGLPRLIGISKNRLLLSTPMTNETIAFVRGKLRKIWPGLPSTRAAWRRSVTGTVKDVARLTLATVLGYLLTVKLLPPPVDLTGALTALLVTQASLRGSFRAGLVRVGAVVSGILVALVVATFVGLHWWSLAMVVLAALLIARILQLGDGGAEAAISAMLILGSSGFEVAAQTRFLTTMIGTFVGITLPLVLPRRVQTTDLTRDLQRVALRLRSVYRDAARYLTINPMDAQAADQWLDSVRSITPLVAQADLVLDDAADLQHLNTRQMFEADVVPLLRGGLDTLERTTLSTRQALAIMRPAAGSGTLPDDGYGDDVRLQIAVVLGAVGEAIEAYESLIEAEVSGGVVAAETELTARLAKLRIARNDLSSVMLDDPSQSELWVRGGSLLSAIDQVIADIDLAAYSAIRDSWRSSQLGRTLPAGPIGPRIRSPWGLLAQRRLRERAARAREEHPEGSHEVGSEETTVLMPAAS